MAKHKPAGNRATEMRAVLKSQYRAALRMLEAAIKPCPRSLWLSRQGHAAAYWQIAFHTLFYTHFYLQPDAKSMVRWAGHRGQYEDLGTPGDKPYTRAEMLAYLRFVRTRLNKWVDAMDLESADCGFWWYRQGKLEHQINNIRHVQHHAAQLGDRLRSVTGKGLAWARGARANVE